MDKVIAEVAEMLMGRSLVELEVIRGMVLRFMYPAPNKPTLPPDGPPRRHFFEVVWYAAKPIILGGEG